MRACSWAVRGAHDPFEGRRNHTCSAVLAVVSHKTSRAACLRRESTCEGTRGRGERVGGTA